MASESTKLQVNFKLADGTLINLYADGQADLETQLAAIQDLAGFISTVSDDLGRANKTVGAVNIVQERLGGIVVNALAPAVQQSPLSYGLDQCKHGARTFRESKPGAPKAWKGYFCPTPKGTPDQCEPNFAK